MSANLHACMSASLHACQRACMPAGSCPEDILSAGILFAFECFCVLESVKSKGKQCFIDDKAGPYTAPYEVTQCSVLGDIA